MHDLATPSMRTELSDAMLRLRAPQPADADLLYEAARESIAEVGRWLAWCHPQYSRHESIAWLDSVQRDWQIRAAFTFFVFDRENGRLLGGCGLNEFDWPRRRANLGYWVRTGDTRRGVATAATRIVARWGLEQLALQRIEIVSAVENIASQCVATKAGAHREGVLRNRLRVADVPTDAVVFGLTPDDLTTLIEA